MAQPVANGAGTGLAPAASTKSSRAIALGLSIILTPCPNPRRLHALPGGRVPTACSRHGADTARARRPKVPTRRHACPSLPETTHQRTRRMRGAAMHLQLNSAGPDPWRYSLVIGAFSTLLVSVPKAPRTNPTVKTGFR